MESGTGMPGRVIWESKQTHHMASTGYDGKVEGSEV